MSETELKYLVDADRVDAVEAALLSAGAQTTQLESRYFDTADQRLAAAGLALRLRRSGDSWEQTLKAAGHGPAVREEETVSRDGEWGSAGPAFDPMLFAHLASGRRMLDLLGEDAPELALTNPYTSFIRRLAVEIDTGEARIEVALDRGEVRAGARTARVCEVEYELKAGDPRALVSIARQGVLDHSMVLSTLTKSGRGIRLCMDEPEPTRPIKARAPSLVGCADAVEIHRRVVSGCLDHVLANASQVVEGEVSAELVHQVRVGLRRLRTAARELDGLAIDWDQEWEAPLADVFRALGRYRDRSSVAFELQRRLLQAGSPSPRLHPPAGDDDLDPVALMRGSAFQLALLDVVEYTLGSPGVALAPVAAVLGTETQVAARGSGLLASIGGSESRGAARERIGARLDKLHRQLKRGARDFGSVDPATRHQVRKRLKRLRYLSEMVGGLYRRAALKRYLARLEPAQDALGSYMDLVVGIGLAREGAEAGEATAWFNVGWLNAELPRSAKNCERALERAAGAEPFWRGRGR